MVQTNETGAGSTVQIKFNNCTFVMNDSQAKERSMLQKMFTGPDIPPEAPSSNLGHELGKFMGSNVFSDLQFDIPKQPPLMHHERKISMPLPFISSLSAKN